MVIRRRLAIRTKVHTTTNSHGSTVVQQQQLNNKSPTYISRKTTFSQKLFFRSPWTHFSFFQLRHAHFTSLLIASSQLSGYSFSLNFLALCFYFNKSTVDQRRRLYSIYTSTRIQIKKKKHTHTNIVTYINACTISFSCLQETSFAISLYFNSVNVAITHQFLMHYIHIHSA